MAEAYSVAELAREVNDLRVDVGTLKATQSLNHAQNRGDIHEIRNILQDLVDKVTGIEIKNAKWGVLSGIATAAVTAAILKSIEHLIK